MHELDDRDIEGVDLDGLRRALEQTEVVFAVLFGSRVEGTAHTESDVDIALRFPESLTPKARFRLRNRIDAELQSYAEGFVDVSDFESLPVSVAHAALQNGLVMCGDEGAVSEYRGQVTTEYETTKADRDREREEFLDRLARGDV
jgi:predicted nucleotidyltransferase